MRTVGVFTPTRTGFEGVRQTQVPIENVNVARTRLKRRLITGQRGQVWFWLL